MKILIHTPNSLSVQGHERSPATNTLLEENLVDISQNLDDQVLIMHFLH